MRIHPEGHGIIAAVAVALLMVNGVVGMVAKRATFFASLVASSVSLAMVASFFRSPQRDTPTLSGAVLAPADGRIVNIARVYEGEYFADERLMVSIFLSVTNVHQNWVPLSGKVIYQCYHPGKYLVAFHPKSSELNERNTIVIQAPSGHPILIRQIAGLVARRIRSYMEINEPVTVGNELGFIKFGSRVDIFLPLDSHLQVEMYQAVKGSETVLAHLPY